MKTKEQKAEYMRNYRKNNSEKYYSSQKKYYEKNKHKRRAYIRKNKEKVKFWNIKSKYKINKKEYESLIKSQNNKCGICNCNLHVKNSHIDHNHKNNKIRGILCHHCNTGIGLLKENIIFLKNAIEYLTKA